MGTASYTMAEYNRRSQVRAEGGWGCSLSSHSQERATSPSLCLLEKQSWNVIFYSFFSCPSQQVQRVSLSGQRWRVCWLPAPTCSWKYFPPPLWKV